MTTTSADAGLMTRIRDAIRSRDRFLITSHERPDGDAIGSELAMAFALREIGKLADVISRDPAPEPMRGFPGVSGIQLTAEAAGEYDALIVMECGDLSRPGIAGLDRYFIINIDHHPGNKGYGALNWFDPSAAACGELVFELVRALGAPLTIEIATHVYLAITTDTGSFHYSSISARTFDICRQLVEAGVDPVAMARAIWDSNSVGRLKLFGAVLSALELHGGGRVALLHVDDALLRATGGTYDDTDGLINLPLTVKDIVAVAFFKQARGGEYRVSFRSKGAIDVGGVAKSFGGGGHKNAAGATLAGPLEELKRTVVATLEQAVAERPS